MVFDASSVPIWADLLKVPFVIIFLIILFFYLELWFLFFDKIKKIFLKYEYIFYLTIIIIILIISLLLQFVTPTSGDLRYPVRISYFISQGYTPYLDFFEHHNPLYGYLTALLFILFHGLVPIYLLHLLSFFILILSCFLVYKIGMQIFQNKRYSYLMVVFFLSIKNVIVSYNIRQDVLAAFFLILASFYLLKYKKHKYLIYSGISLGISFLFVQKTTFHIICFFILVLLLHGSVVLRIKRIIYISIGSLLPFLLFFAFFYLQNGLYGLQIYYVVNFLYNTQIMWGFDIFNRLFAYFITNGIHFLFIILGTIVFIKKYKQLEKFWCAFLLICSNLFVLLIFVFKFGRVSPQDFLYFIPILSIPGTVFIIFLSKKIKKVPQIWEKYVYVFLLIFLIVTPVSLASLNLVASRDDYEINLYLTEFAGEKTNCNFVYNPLYKYHWAIYFGPEESKKEVMQLFNRWGLDDSEVTLNELIKDNIKIICLEKGIDREGIEILLKKGYKPYSDDPEYSRIFVKK